MKPIHTNDQSSDAALSDIVHQHFSRSMTIPAAFFEAEAEQIAQACWAMARRFHQGGRLITFGNGSWATDAQHVAVEFVHPVIVGKRAWPALALTNDSALLSGLAVGQPTGIPFVRQLAVLARTQDIALGFSADGHDVNILAALSQAHDQGLLTLALTGRAGGRLAQAELDFCFVVPTDEPLVSGSLISVVPPEKLSVVVKRSFPEKGPEVAPVCALTCQKYVPGVRGVLICHEVCPPAP